jgi:hypothetical protein
MTNMRSAWTTESNKLKLKTPWSQWKDKVRDDTQTGEDSGHKLNCGRFDVARFFLL